MTNKYRRWKSSLIILGCILLLSSSILWFPIIGEYFGEGNSICNDSLDFLFSWFHDWEIKSLIIAMPFPSKNTADEIEVYQALFTNITWEGQFPSESPSGPGQATERRRNAEIVIQEKTYWQPEIKRDSIFHMIRKYGSPWMIYDFHRKNALWADKHDLHLYSSNVYSISPEEMDNIFQSRRSWEDYHEEFPSAGCIHGVSRVGFSWDRNHAIVHFSWQCGPLWGEGNFIFLTKKNGKWVIAKKARTWIS